MDQHELHEMAQEVAERILSGPSRERFGVTKRRIEHARVFEDLVELAKQVLREEEAMRIRALAA